MVEQAKKNDANEDITHAIKNLPRDKFRTTVDIDTLLRTNQGDVELILIKF